MNIFDSSFINFIYPFTFDARSFNRHSAEFESSEVDCGRHKYQTWKKHKLDLDEMLPHVAQQIQPNVAKSSVRLWELNKGAFTYLAGKHNDWQLCIKNENNIPFTINSIQLMMIEGGVGFITVNAAPLNADKATWFNFLHYFRFIKGQRKAIVQANILSDSTLTEALQYDAIGGSTCTTSLPADGGGKTHSKTGKNFIDYISALLNTGSYKQPYSYSGSGAWWQEAFISGQLLPFTALLIDEVDAGQEPELIYQLRNFFNETQALYPAPEDLRLDHPSLLPYAVRQWFFFSLDGGGFIGLDAPKDPAGFFRQTLIEHLREQYFLLYVFALYQRFALVGLSSQVARDWLGQHESNTFSVSKREESFRYIRDRMMGFTARVFFTQIMQREHHHRVYRKWQEVFQIQALYEEVRDEIQEMHSYLMMRRSETEQQTTQRIQWLIGSLGIISIVISFLGINVRGVTSQDGASLKTAVLLVLEGTVEVGGVFLVLVYIIVLISKKRRGDNAKRHSII